ncbi:MAG: hypothetical protein NE330_04990 [Lentisphaeraceae bacterium]|nr:hypothetical protein [Lentisphaeraceae bacterium]
MKKKFTLIELIIIIAIIAILLSLLLPAIRKSKRAGLSTVCKVNHSELYKANISYQKANNHKLVNRYIKIDSVFYRWPSLLWDHYQSTSILQCPEDDRSSSLYPISVNPNEQSLMKVLSAKNKDDIPTGYNDNIHSKKTSLLKFRKPDETPMFGDSKFYRLQAPKGNTTWYYPLERHIGGTNFQLTDGHVETKNLTNALKYEWLPY